MAPEQPAANGSGPKLDGHKNGHSVGGYRLIREIETDSLGVMYEAEHPRMHRKVALRTIDAGVARDVSFSRRFLLELRSYVALEHEAIPRLYELAYDRDQPYLVTEMVAGRTLDDVLGSGVQYAAGGILELLRPIASAIDYAHSRATIHRDVKPANILLANDGRTLLTGFGLGTVATFNTGPGAGSQVAPDYVAPERLVGREVDGRADVYSLAAVIFEAVTGRRPFSSKSWIETLSRRLYEPPPTVHELVPDLPSEFSQVLQNAMDRDPARRPSSAGELLDRLEAALNAPSNSRPAHWLQPAMHQGSLGISAVLVLLVGAAEATWLLSGSGLSLVVRVTHWLFGAG